MTLPTRPVYGPPGPGAAGSLWNAGWTERDDQLEGLHLTASAPELPEMNDVQTTMADLWATGMTPEGHPFVHLRDRLRAGGILSVTDLGAVDSGRRVSVAGMITHRQRPGTAGGVTFLNLEDETGMLNVICTVGVWRRHREVATSSAGMVIRGIVEHEDGATNLLADRLGPLAEIDPAAGAALQARHRSRDFH